MLKIHPALCDPSGNFVALRACTIQGQTVRPGERVDTSGMTPTLIEKLTRVRFIRPELAYDAPVVGNGKRTAKVKEPEARSLEGLNLQELQAVCVAHNVNRFGNRKTLLKRLAQSGVV